MRAVANEASRGVIKMFGKAGVTAIVFRLLIPTTALAADVQWTLERDEAIANTEVGPERWTITYRISDGRVVGNVHHEDGSPSSFVQCNRIEILGNEETFECFGADACSAAPCEDEYAALPDVTVPPSFFLPPGSDVPPSEAVRRLQSLTGTWRFDIGGENPSSKEFQLGERIHQLAPPVFPALALSLEGTANVTRLLGPELAVEHEFLLSDIVDLREGNVDFYMFNIVDEDRVEGTFRSGERLEPLTGTRISG